MVKREGNLSRIREKLSDVLYTTDLNQPIAKIVHVCELENNIHVIQMDK